MAVSHPDEITEPTVRLCWNDHAIRGAVDVLRRAHLHLMADQMEAQLPKPVPEEPDAPLVELSGALYRQLERGLWEQASTCFAYRWAVLLEKHPQTEPIIYDRRATPPTEEVAEPARDVRGPSWDGSNPLSEADPLEALIQTYGSRGWHHADDDIDPDGWVEWAREFAERVRALTTEDTVPAGKVRELVAIWRSEPGFVKFLNAADGLEDLLPKAGQ